MSERNGGVGDSFPGAGGVLGAGGRQNPGTLRPDASGSTPLSYRRNAPRRGCFLRGLSRRAKIVLVVGLVVFVIGAGSLTAELIELNSKKSSIAAAESAADSAEPASPKQTKSEKPTNSADAPECTAAQLEIAPVINADSFAPGDKPEFAMTITNKSEAACQRNLGTSQMLFQVSSGGQKIWSSKDCQTNPDNRPVLIAAGQTLQTENLVWQRTVSALETCEAERVEVDGEGAAYQLSVQLGDIAGSEYKQFLLY
ncbi:hypothetical protein KJY77_04580 [Canibacter sp. lx-72]|uniref:hypothetical protein n=1 Tax=Canibacter zhuwentaonis TaxID=2837491 RepID=UPI001BDD5BD0|nr:hypothetical protein [Canibacter zhuwentaonis]MBT1018416.1 hypothetical protein [Canibacter zhuwentaonis]